MQERFCETRLEGEGSHLRLTDCSGNLIFELKGYQIEDAIRCGFLDPTDYHFSIYEFAKIRGEAASVAGTMSADEPSKARIKDLDAAFLADLNIGGD